MYRRRLCPLPAHRCKFREFYRYAQKPKMSPYIEQMRANIADACGVDISAVSVKATTEEKLGFTGREEGISAHAVALIK